MRQLATTLFGTGTIVCLASLLIDNDAHGLFCAIFSVIGAVAVALLEDKR